MTDFTNHSDAITFASARRARGRMQHAPSITGRIVVNDGWKSDHQQTFNNTINMAHERFESIYGIPLNDTEHLTQSIYKGRRAGQLNCSTCPYVPPRREYMSDYGIRG